MKYLLILLAGLLLSGCSQTDAGQRLTEWTAPANDGYDAATGPVSGYAMAWAEDSALIVQANAAQSIGWQAVTGVTIVEPVITPADPGSIESWMLQDLPNGVTIWASVKAVDPAGNWATLGNIHAYTITDDVAPGAIMDLH